MYVTRISCCYNYYYHQHQTTDTSHEWKYRAHLSRSLASESMDHGPKYFI